MPFLLLVSIALPAELNASFEGELLPLDSPPPPDTGAAGCSGQGLVDGVLLPDLPLFYFRQNPHTAWGTAELVGLLVETGRQMRWLLPDASPLTIGDLSEERGGPLSTHVSHRGGVDADVGLFHTGARQDMSFYPLADDFDAEANWTLVSTLLQSGKVDFILIDASHIARLRAYTLARGLLTVEEADGIFLVGPGFAGEPGFLHHAPNHTDHLHVRVLCADGTRAR